MQFHTPLVLASGSPRRRQLLDQLHVEFIIDVEPVDEVIPPGADPAEVVASLARLKGASVARRRKDSLVLSADTIVVLENEILGKPTDETDASRMLASLAGRTHSVFTGIALHHHNTERTITAVEETRVTFAPLSRPEIEAYVATGSPMDKAGAYGIQDDRGALFVSRIEGDFYNVVGLPLHRLYATLKIHFHDLIRLDS